MEPAAATAPVPPAAAQTSPHLKTAAVPLTDVNKPEAATEVSEELAVNMKALRNKRKHRFVTMKIEGNIVVSDCLGPPSDGPAQLEAVLPAADCRYVLYDYEFTTADGRKTSKLLFISWLPPQAQGSSKMAYAHGKMAVRQLPAMQGLIDVMATSFADISSELGVADEESDESDLDV